MTATARIDPRIRARRVAVIKAQGRRRLRVVVAALVAIGVVVGGWLLVTSPVLDVDRIDVVGAVAVSEREVLDAAGVDVGDALLLLDLGELERRIEAVPAVAEARVRRRLPDGLRITVAERDPAAWVPRPAGGVAVLDTTGRVIADAAAPPALPEIAGLARVPAAGATSRPGGVAAGLLDELPPELRSRVRTIAVHEGEAGLTLDDGLEIRLGPPTAARVKGQAALAVIDAIGDDPAVTYVDVRVPAGPVTGST